ncbi:MAG: diguanylate cyclase [Selenomonadaceae bacterium]|nr:diguanylate cyclase [Selenomonadaceae bacterium]
MNITKSVRDKLFVLLIVIGALPLILVLIVGASKMISELEEIAVTNGTLRNAIISEHMTELVEKNFYVLRSMALNPVISNCLIEPTSERLSIAAHVLDDTNSVFGDDNLMALTGADAKQLVRTDRSELVNVSKRRHFHEAMRGNDFVSDVMVSMSTGRLIVVVESPVLDRDSQKPIGMVQRNLNLDQLQRFIETQDDKDISVIVLDREDKVIAYSDVIVNFAEEHALEGKYSFITEQIGDNVGAIRADFDGEDSLICYSRNELTGWLIITVHPYHIIMDRVYGKIIESITLGTFMLLLVIGTAYILSSKATRPILEIKDAADKIIQGNGKFEKIEVSSEDELGQMAEAFNKIRSDRDAYQMESELDKLTKLYNKTTMERACKMKLKNFNEQSNETILALYVIDLDHFKEMNDTYGHQFGDKVLIEFSRVLRKQFRPNDCIGRFGGDEFVVIIDNLPGMGIVVNKAERIKAVASNLVVDGIKTSVTASIGIAVAPQHGTDYETLFKSADESLYHVKANGRNGFYYASAETIG